VAVAAESDFAVAGEGPGWPRAVGRLLGAAIAANEGRLVLWLPVAMAAGIGSYFALPAEPSELALGAISLVAAASLYRLVRCGSSAWLLFLAMTCLGFFLAKFQVTMSTGPAVAAASDIVQISGFVEEIVRAPRRSLRVVLRVQSISGLEKSQWPRKLRVTSPFQRQLRVGNFVEAGVRLFPLQSPVMPGGYDFARVQWLQGLGASATAREPLRIDRGRSPPITLMLKSQLEELRIVMAERIRAALPGELGLLAVALITGERASLPKAMNRSLQASGLAHIVSISGLHMSLVAGGFFWMLRALLALSAELANCWPIKKWCAGAALLAGAIYLALSGCEVPTQRSYIMVAIMFAAIIAGRPALNLRNVALAAMLVLSLDPAALLQPGLQMSFLAVTGLLSFFEAWHGISRNGERLGWVRYALKRGAAALLALSATTIIAGISTGPPAAFHFNRIAPYGLIGNLLAVPVVSAVVMPMALLGSLLMPLGLEQWAFQLMGIGLKTVMSISDWTASLPGAQIVVPRHSSASALLMAGAILSACLLVGPARWCGLPLFLIGLVLASLAPRPDVLVERSAGNVAVRNEFGDLVVARPRRSHYSTERWLLADGDDSSPVRAAARPGFRCADHLCSAMVKGKLVIFADKNAERKFQCPKADLLIAAFPLRGACKEIGLRIDRFDVWRNGAYALFIEEGVIRIETSRERRGARPWVVKPQPRKDRQRGPDATDPQ
jgi:competence protein ComEC